MNRIADLVTQLEHGGGDADSVREDARALLAEVLAYHREGLGALVRAIDPAKLAEAARDPLVASLFELHEIDAPAPSALLPETGLLKKSPAKRDVHGTI